MSMTDKDKNKLLDGWGLARVIAKLKQWIEANFFAKSEGNPLGVADGGTGITANPSMLVNLESTSADDVFKASPRPGVTGVLPVTSGGTGLTAVPESHALVGGSTGTPLTTVQVTTSSTANTIVQRDESGKIEGDVSGIADVAKAANISGERGVVYIDTTGTFHCASNGRLTGSIDGALYSVQGGTSGGGGYIDPYSAPQFGTLPVKCGGTGAFGFSRDGALLKYNSSSSKLDQAGTVGGQQQAVYLNNGVPTAGFKVLYGTSLPEFNASNHPKGTIFIVTSN